LRKLGIILLGILIPHYLFAQSQIESGEYFFDNDPGLGSATDIPAFTAGTAIDITPLINSASLSL
jgi:hypothetical protein